MARSPSAPDLSFRDRLLRDWYSPRRTSLTLLLAPLGWLFGTIVACRRVAYRLGLAKAATLPVPVIVVGNVTVGGTGKTPLAIRLVEALVARGRRPGIVSRGYGGSATTPRPVDIHDDAGVTGDEPLLLARTGRPVWIGADRVAAARGLLMVHPDVDVIVSDDGLQHYALPRACEIVVVDGERGFGNGALLPAGPLREPVSRIAAADALVINGPAGAANVHEDGPPAFAMTLRGERFTSVAAPLRECDSGAFSGKSVHAVAGIGNPRRFFDTLRMLGVDAACHSFSDHHVYSPADLAFDGADAILMTEKDAIKCRAFADARMWFLPVVADVDDGLIERVLEKVDGSQAA